MVTKTEKIDAEPIVVTGITEDKELPVVLILPEGVESMSKEDIMAELKVSEETTKTITIPVQTIELIGGKEGLNYTLSGEDNITVAIKGSEDTLSGITSKNFTASIDVSELSEGTTQMSISVECDQMLKNMECTPNQIGVTVSGN